MMMHCFEPQTSSIFGACGLPMGPLIGLAPQFHLAPLPSLFTASCTLRSRRGRHYTASTGFSHWNE